MKKTATLLLLVALFLACFAGCTESGGAQDGANSPAIENNEDRSDQTPVTDENTENEENTENVTSKPLYTRANKEGEEDENGSYILFGEYPQTIKALDVTVTETADENGYYLGSDGCRYVKVTAAPLENGYAFSNGASVVSGKKYYFKVEPIRWCILSEEDGAALLLCDSILETLPFDAHDANGDFSNNYAESDVRAWLCERFYESAFSPLAKELIQTVTVDNSESSTKDRENEYACENTEDPVFLLSYKDAINYKYGFSQSSSIDDKRRQKTTSDYARAMGAFMLTEEDSSYGNGMWWLRSPDSFEAFYALAINDLGDLAIHGITEKYHGVVPAIKLHLGES